MVRRRRKQLKATQLRLNSLGKMFRRNFERKLGLALHKEEEREKGLYKFEGEKYLHYPQMSEKERASKYYTPVSFDKQYGYTFEVDIIEGYMRRKSRR